MRSNAFFVKLTAFLTVILYIIVGALNGVPFAGKKYAPEHAEDIRLNAVLTADVHVDSDPLHPRNILLMKFLLGVGKSDAPVDALILAGDIANLAEQKEYIREPRFRQHEHGQRLRENVRNDVREFP